MIGSDPGYPDLLPGELETITAEDCRKAARLSRQQPQATGTVLAADLIHHDEPARADAFRATSDGPRSPIAAEARGEARHHAA